MEYRAREDGRIQSSIFLEIDPAILRLEGVKFTPDVANKSGVEAESVANVDHLIDFEVLYSVTDWSDPLIQERLKVAKKYEVLVPNLVPLSLIRNVPHG